MSEEELRLVIQALSFLPAGVAVALALQNQSRRRTILVLVLTALVFTVINVIRRTSFIAGHPAFIDTAGFRALIPFGDFVTWVVIATLVNLVNARSRTKEMRRMLSRADTEFRRRLHAFDT